MPRALRYYESGAVYEVCFRAKDTLPLVCNDIIKFIIQCIVARVQRDEKVTLCHYIWNGSHPHLIVVCKDAQQLVNFYSEIQKKITDSIKCLLGLKYLELWEGKASVIKLGDLDAVKDRIAYLYSNPANDDLEDCIERFPGLSSWKDYQNCLNHLTDRAVKLLPWIRLKSIPKLSSDKPSLSEGLQVIQILKELNKKSHKLIKSPNVWMACFGVTADEEVLRINTQIAKRLRLKESQAREKRIARKQKVFGASNLRAQPILKIHTPKKKNVKIFIITTVNQCRIDFIRQMREFTHKCRKCFQRWKSGELSVKWPDGAFKPPMPPTVSLLTA